MLALSSTAILLVCLSQIALAINFELSPGKEECFFEDVHQGTNINGAYAVVRGSHLDIDVSIFGPGGKQVYNAQREGEGKFMLKADKDGTYKFCFSNKMSVISHKTVKLVITTGDPIDFSKLARKESMDNVERWIVSISHTVRMIDFHQQEYRILHERHLSNLTKLICMFGIQSSAAVTQTNRRVKMWSFLECLAVMAVSGIQVMYIKRMFNKNGPGVKRMV